MATKLSNFISDIGQGVKPNMFMVDIAFPGEVSGAEGDADMINLLCKSAALPASNLGVIEVPFRGRTCLLYTSPSPRDATLSRMPSSA